MTDTPSEAEIKDRLDQLGRLRQAIGHVHGVNPTGVVCGSGSDELISLLCQAYVGPGDEVVFSQHGFLMYPISAKAAGATPVSAPETDLTANVDALLAAVTDKTRILFLANPNNPTGTYLTTDEVIRLHDGLNDDVLLVIDAAYAEYVGRADYTSGAELVEAYDNVVMTRTFSKIYGLGGIRLGWAYCSEAVVDVLHRIRGPFNVNGAAQAAGTAAVRDAAFSGHRCSRQSSGRLCEISVRNRARGIASMAWRRSNNSRWRPRLQGPRHTIEPTERVLVMPRREDAETVTHNQRCTSSGEAL